MTGSRSCFGLILVRILTPFRVFLLTILLPRPITLQLEDWLDRLDSFQRTALFDLTYFESPLSMGILRCIGILKRNYIHNIDALI